MGSHASAAELEALLAGLIDAGVSNPEIAERSGSARSTIRRIDNHQMPD